MSHTTNQRHWFINLKPFDEPQTVNVGKKDQSIAALGRGDINILAFNGNQWIEKHLSKVLYLPNLRYNLFSAGSALDKGLLQISTARGCRFEKDGIIVAVGARINRLCEMKFKVLVPEYDKIEATLAVRDDLRSWHEKLAHQNTLYVKQYLTAQGIQIADEENFFCEGCVYGKSHRLPFPKRKPDYYKTQAPGELVHADLCGAFQENSINGSRCFLLFKDDFSRYRTVYFLRSKDEAVNRIRDFLAMTQNHVGRKVRTLRTGNGLEFLNSEVAEMLRRSGIQHQRTVVYTPQQNGVAERENRTLVEVTRTMIHAKGLPLRLWAEGVNAAAYVINRTRSSPQHPRTPYEL